MAGAFRSVSQPDIARLSVAPLSRSRSPSRSPSPVLLTLPPKQHRRTHRQSDGEVKAKRSTVYGPGASLLAPSGPHRKRSRSTTHLSDAQKEALLKDLHEAKAVKNSNNPLSKLFRKMKL